MDETTTSNTHTTEQAPRRQRRVIVESPLRGRVPRFVPGFLRPPVEWFGRWANKRYANMCLIDALARDEAPFAAHVQFDRRGLLNDAIPEERAAGMRAGRAWEGVEDLVAVYVDFGISEGMRAAMGRAEARGARVEERRLFR